MRLKKFLPEFVYGGTDGAVTTFAIIAGAIGAGFSSSVVLILGFANLFADGFSMAASDFLSKKSESNNQTKTPFSSAFVTFVSFSLVGFIPLFSFVLAPVLGFSENAKFVVSAILTGLAFIFVGYVKGVVTGKHKFFSSLETLLVGSMAAYIAFAVGVLLGGLIE